MRRRVLEWCRLALRVVLPVDCMSCAQPLGMDHAPYMCDACWDKIVPISGPRCSQCDQPFASKTAEVWIQAHRCQQCLDHPPVYERAWTLYPYIPPLRHAICALKYRNVFGLAKPLAALMIRALPEQVDVDLIVPVPLHPSRLRAREYNQALLFADHLGRYLMQPVSSTDFVRTIATEPQTSLARRERLRNLRRAFTVKNPEAFTGRRVLLIDDVVTTGTTLNECARALRAAGAASVSALALARTLDQSLVPDRVWAGHNAQSFQQMRS